jgi:UDP-N-acetylmuramate--alanine ligase
VIAMSLELGLPIEKIKDSLKGFGGLKRRTEILGEKDGVLYIDDYGHHPAEIRTTLDGLKNFYPDRRVRCVFQAHTFSRTESLIDEFAKCFSGAEEVLITDIFGSAREDVKSFDVNGEKLAWEIKRHHKNVKYTPRFEDAVASLREDMKVGDLVVCMGAGNAYEVALNLLEN